MTTPKRPDSETRERQVVRTAEFAPFGEIAETGAPQNLDLIMDLSLRVTVELGRTVMSVREVLSLGPGAVVQLDKLAGEQVDILINDRLVAKGEVVVVDENFGVRIIDILTPNKRIVAR
jgi:flagellar motor switch protein FliN/FliY